MKLYAVIHFELFRAYEGDQSAVTGDGMLFHIASSKKKAEKYIKDVMIDPYSWWIVMSFKLDEPDFIADGGMEVWYYSHRGTPLKSQPWARAQTALKKAEADPESLRFKQLADQVCLPQGVPHGSSCSDPGKKGKPAVAGKKSSKADGRTSS